MKKNLFLFVGIMIALASCSADDIVEKNNDGAIKFNASVGHSSDTRGIESTSSDLKSFYVSAMAVGQEYPFFTNTLFTRNSSGDFVSDPAFHWSHQLVLDFYAYGYCTKDKKALPAVPDLNIWGEWIEFTNDQKTIDRFSPRPNIEDQVDFIFAKKLGATQPGMTSTISLGFRHMLSEVGVDAACSSRTHRVKVAKIKYGNIYNRAQFDMETATHWNLEKGKTNYEIELPTPVVLDGTRYNISLAEAVNDPIGYAILLPQEHSTVNTSTECFSAGNDGVLPQGKVLTSAPYLAILCRIELLDQTTGEPTGTLKFPVKDDYKIEYDGETYGWAYIPFHMAKDSDSATDREKYSKWQMGMRYKYHLDFTEGAGYNDDGDPIIMGPISIKTDVSEWTAVDIYPPRK